MNVDRLNPTIRAAVLTAVVSFAAVYSALCKMAVAVSVFVINLINPKGCGTDLLFPSECIPIVFSKPILAIGHKGLSTVVFSRFTSTELTGISPRNFWCNNNLVNQLVSDSNRGDRIVKYLSDPSAAAVRSECDRARVNLFIQNSIGLFGSVRNNACGGSLLPEDRSDQLPAHRQEVLQTILRNAGRTTLRVPLK